MGIEIVIGEKNQADLRLGLVQISVAFDESNRGEIFQMCASSNMTVYAIEMTRLEVNCKLVTLQSGSSQLFEYEEDFTMKYKIY